MYPIIVIHTAETLQYRINNTEVYSPQKQTFGSIIKLSNVRTIKAKQGEPNIL